MYVSMVFICEFKGIWVEAGSVAHSQSLGGIAKSYMLHSSLLSQNSYRSIFACEPTNALSFDVVTGCHNHLSL